MKLVAEYLVDAIKFDRMAEDATDVALKASFRKQVCVPKILASGWLSLLLALEIAVAGRAAPD